MSTPSETRYVWSVINKIAKHWGKPPKEVYEIFVREISPTQFVEVAENHEKEVLENLGGGIGTTAEVVVRKPNGYVVIAVKRGMSWFSHEQTKMLIKNLERFAWDNKIPLG